MIKTPQQWRWLVYAFIWLCTLTTSYGQISWPQNQLLPSFPSTAPTQDLIILRETSQSWEAEGPALGHNTGHIDGDGWLCQTGIDAPNQHMIYGPYVTTLPAGGNTANFRIKVDNNTANNDPMVTIDVRDATTGQGLASRIINRQDFATASTYNDFSLPFTIPADGHSIELRVFWHGGAYIKVDRLWVNRSQSTDEMVLFASLKGIVNKTQPRIFSYEGDAFAEGQYTWLNSLGLGYNEPADKWDLISKYLNEIDGIIVYDNGQPHTINLATTLAANQNALVVAPSLVSRLTSAPYNLPIVMDMRGQFTSKLQVYQTLFNNYWSGLDKRVLIGLNPNAHKAALREYATALGAAVIWLDPNVSGESELLNNFLSSMPAGANYMGWWPEEGPGVERASNYGIATIASDWSTNLTVHSGMPRTVNVSAPPAKPALQNKLYVAFILSDGDNLQYVEHLMRKLWNNPDRGSVPIGWTLSPAMLDAMPGALNFYYQTATNNDNLISGPSGYGYSYPNSYPNATSLNRFVTTTEDYTKRAGFRVVTIWNTITGGINQNVGQSFANHAPSLLGLTAQNTGGGLSIYNNSMPGMALSCNYCTNEQAMKDHIGYASENWDGNSPRFIIIQAQPWQGVTPTSFKNVANSLNSNYVVVRPDHIFQLIREANGLNVNPGNGLPEPPEGYSAWQSHNFSDRYIRHASSRGRIDANISPVNDAYWKMVPGLAGAGVSFQSRNFPNRYLRHRSGEVWLDDYENTDGYKQDATFYLRAGLADGSKQSFESYNLPGSYIRHRNSELFVESISNDLGRNDATFKQLGGSTSTFSIQIEGESFSLQSGIQVESCVEGGNNVGYIDADDWMVYDINVPASGSYMVEYRVASPNSTGTLQLENAGGSPVYGTVNISNTGGWQNWTTVSHTVNLNSGQQQLAIKATAGGWNINWLRISSSSAAAYARVAQEDDIEGNKDLKIYPNPSTHTLNIIGLQESTHMEIFDLSGSRISSTVIEPGQSIDISQLKAGTYLIQLTNINGSFVRKFIKK
ncbi:AbfB domain-containing protein [Fulvivirga ligni]|uniref:AbfB domain-containing protein n=1 Tax=Fulvivirga ligni TaxID=2904246 RepID=UPI001F3F1860|nr:AbfB domain-containing protein [Fulvivirga ligni]UII24112.1 AbfB domain-containing protein [Fulvivirga ligni]